MNQAMRRTFLEQYAIIRHAEGRGSRHGAFYHALPYADLSGRNSRQWRIRARSFDYFLRHVLAPLEKNLGRPLDLLDLGAGNGWMTRRLAERGHGVVAVDILMDHYDGLGAIRKYARLNAVAADFDQLPFGAKYFDVVIYNASLHYSSDYRRTLTEAVRCLRPSGIIVILDSPVYAKAEHGERMRRERQSRFEQTYGFRSEALGSIEYLDRAMLRRLSRDLQIELRLSKPWYGWRWAMRPMIARLLGRRPPSKFFVISASLL